MNEPFLKLQATRMPKNLDDFQLHIDTAFAAGRAYGNAEARQDTLSKQFEVKSDHTRIQDFKKETIDATIQTMIADMNGEIEG